MILFEFSNQLRLLQKSFATVELLSLIPKESSVSCLKNFVNKKSTLSLKLTEILLLRLNERRHLSLIELLKYLKCGKMYSTNKAQTNAGVHLKSLSKKSVLLSEAKILLARLYQESRYVECESHSDNEEANQQVRSVNCKTCDLPKSVTLLEKMDLAIKRISQNNRKREVTSQSLKNNFKRELEMLKPREKKLKVLLN